MSLRRTHARRLLTIACVAGISVLVAAPSAGAADALTVTKSKVLRNAEPIAHASVAKKKGKRKATTRTLNVPFGNGSAVIGTARCTGKSHLTGGGFAAEPRLDAGSLTGLRSTSVISFPAGRKEWTAGSSSFDGPATTGMLTTYARCESNSLGRTITISASGLVPPAVTTNAVLNCPGKTHAVGGGYSAAGLANSNFNGSGLRSYILQSRRTLVRQWTVTAYTDDSSPEAAPFTAYAICERDGKGRNVRQTSTLTPIAENVRADAQPTCSGKRHVVSGGFAFTDADPTTAVAAVLDESRPVGKKAWQIGSWELPQVLNPLGATLESFAYCKRLPKPKKK